MSYLLRTRSDHTTQQRAVSWEEQQEKINEVRGLLGSLEAEMPNFLSDATIRRFLRARNWSTEHATKLLKETVKWRREYKPEAICWSKASGKEQIRYMVYILENLAMNTKDEQEEHVVWLCDFRGWAISSTPLSVTRESIHIIQNYYAGMIAGAILSNPPRIFESFWKIAKHFLEPKMKERVKFVYTNSPESQKMVSDMFDLDTLESAFGGRNTAGSDTGKYAERMRRGDQLRGALTHANGHESSSS